jgi:endonuclease/exonuclease/phosphatase family metal-dependent hydrolase
MKNRRAFVLGIVAVAVFSFCFALPSPAQAGNGERNVKVMTRNMDPGVDLLAAATSDDPATVLAALSIVPERARLIAVEIAKTKPDLVALQEATRWRMGPKESATVLDQLELLLQYLGAYGQRYKIAAFNQLTDVQLDTIGYTDRDAILVRSDLPPGQLRVSMPETHVYPSEMLMTFFVPFQDEPLTVLRGWEAVKVEVRGSQFKFVSTHLESPIPDPAYIDATILLQQAQAAQLMEDLKDVKLPIILAGDFNSDAEQTNNYPSDNTISFQIVEGYDFQDAWEELRPNDPGYTWSLYAFEGIPYAPFERIDLIFSNGPEAVSIRRTGLEPEGDFFASDHGGVVAVFDLDHHRTAHGKFSKLKKYPTEYPGCHVAADRLRNLFGSGFRRH